MKKTRRLGLLLLSITLAVGVMTGCGTKQTLPEPGGAVVTDMIGRSVNLAESVERVVVLSPADCEILYALGAGDLVVGRGEYCDFPAEALTVQVVQSGQETNTEQIIALAPQVVIMSNMAQTEQQLQAMEKAGIAVVCTDAQDIAGVSDAIRLIGSVVGKEQEATDLITTLDQRFAAVKARAAAATPAENPTIYFEVSPLEWGLWTAGTDTFMDEIAGLLGLTNIFEDVSGWGEISQEQVVQRSPDYIVTVTMYFGDGPRPVDEIVGRPGWEHVAAVKNAAIFEVDNDAFTRPGLRLADAADTLCDLIYG